MKRLVILQSKKHIIHYKKYNFSNSDIILPLDPSVHFEVDKNKWNKITIKEICKSIDYDLAKKKSEKTIDDLIKNLNDFSKKSKRNLEIGNYYAFQLWIVIGQIHYNYFIIKSIIKNLKPKNILLYSNSINELIYDYRPNPSYIFANVFLNSVFFDDKNHKIIKIKEKEFISFKDLLKKYLPNFFVTYLQKLLYENKKNISVLKSKHRLLLVGPPYEWEKLNQKKNFNETFELIKSKYSLKSKNFDPPLDFIFLFDESVKFNGKIVFSLKKFSNVVFNDLSKFSSIIDVTKNYILKFDAIVGSVFTNPFENFYAHVARMLRKPVILFQHGEKGQSNDVSSIFTELYYSTDYYSYGKEVSLQYKNFINSYNLKRVLTIGSIDKKIKRKTSENILYCTGKWVKTATPFNDDPDPDTRTYNAHMNILNFLNNKKLSNVIFKANNTKSFNSVPYAKQFPNVQIEFKKSFSSLLESSKLVILDAPATTLVEACSTKVPIFVLGGRVNYYKTFVDAVSKRVVWCEDVNELIIKIDKFFNNNIYDADINDKTYLENYFSQNENIDILIKKNILNTLKKYNYE